MARPAAALLAAVLLAGCGSSAATTPAAPPTFTGTPAPAAIATHAPTAAPTPAPTQAPTPTDAPAAVPTSAPRPITDLFTTAVIQVTAAELTQIQSALYAGDPRLNTLIPAASHANATKECETPAMLHRQAAYCQSLIALNYSLYKAFASEAAWDAAVAAYHFTLEHGAGTTGMVKSQLDAWLAGR